MKKSDSSRPADKSARRLTHQCSQPTDQSARQPANQSAPRPTHQCSQSPLLGGPSEARQLRGSEKGPSQEEYQLSFEESSQSGVPRLSSSSKQMSPKLSEKMQKIYQHLDKLEHLQQQISSIDKINENYNIKYNLRSYESNSAQESYKTDNLTHISEISSNENIIPGSSYPQRDRPVQPSITPSPTHAGSQQPSAHAGKKSVDASQLSKASFAKQKPVCQNERAGRESQGSIEEIESQKAPKLTCLAQQIRQEPLSATVSKCEGPAPGYGSLTSMKGSSYKKLQQNLDDLKSKTNINMDDFMNELCEVMKKNWNNLDAVKDYFNQQILEKLKTQSQSGNSGRSLAQQVR